MHLKQIEILGFKSFPEKTVVKFAHGVTAIVGPNGCGKTNVLDSLRWVLGEQKPTLLRGGKMEEVIFNGTGELKPLGMAEVTLSIVNDRGILPTEYHEVQVTRRLFRSGESEYLINKVPCRLKDILDMFADTGVGAHSYSVIQQSMIDSVISDKAEERRFLFEEAAGITKYKQRRKAALRKLEATENDFLRLKDIYAEVKTRVNSLYRQHKKAERYQKLTDEIKAWDIFLSSRRLKDRQTQRRELKAQFDELSDQKAARETSLDTAYAQLEQERKRLLEIEQQLTGIGNEIYGVTEKAHQDERETSVLREKQTNAAQLIEKNRVDIETLDHRASALREQIAEARNQLAQQIDQQNKLTEQLEQATKRQAEADKKLLDARVSREEKNQKLIELEGKLSSGKAEVNTLNEQQEEFAEALSDIEKQVQESLPRQKALVAEIETLREQLDQAESARREKQERQSALLQEIEDRVEAGESFTAELTNLTASIEACQARKHLLEEMMLQYEGYESGVVSAMDVRDRFPGIVSTVAEAFVPVEGMESVLESALGEMARFIICRDRQTAEQVVAYLKDEKKGKVGILVPRSGAIPPAVKRPDLNIPGVVGWLDNYVSASDDLRILKEAVLSRTVVFDETASVDELLASLPYGFTAVSTSGVLYTTNVVSGGSDDRFPLFRRKERVAEQQSLLDEIAAKLEVTQKEKNQNTAQLGALRAESAQLNSESEDLAEDIDELQKKLSECQFQYRTMTAEFDRYEREKQSLKIRLEKIRDRQYSLGLDSSQLANQKESLVDTINQSGDRLSNLEAESARAGEEVSRLQVASIEARSRSEQTESRIKHIEEIGRELESSRTTKQQEIEQASADIKYADERLRTLDESLRDSFARRDELNGQRETLRQSQATLQEQTSAVEARTKQLRHERDTVADRLHQIEITLTSLESEISGLTQKMSDEYGVEIASVEAARPDESISDEDAPKYLQEAKEKLRAFGAVNLLALEEYEVASEREKFLGEQLTDLTTAKNDLRSTISKINQTARQLFFDTFDKVRDNFRGLFVELFNGGEADIRLVDPDDPLESEIEITARPGGKKLLPITMLSGGERALTAIALLFSLYLVKPSPFCILDEIDAPLDDANCHRFLKIIHTFSQNTQFVIITHNKITMQTAHNLYGVTMERPGISKLVAVRFTETDDRGQTVTVDTAASAEYLDTNLPAGIRERIGTDMRPDLPVTRDTEE